MAVREFSDHRGRLWRAWNIMPASVIPPTKADDHLANCYELGWIVFETFDGCEKRRLCPYPPHWDALSAGELDALLEKAQAVSPSKLAGERTLASAVEPTSSGGEETRDATFPPVNPAAERAEPGADVTDLRVVRSFRYPGGRIWSACVCTHPAGGGPAVLRFSAGVRRVDLPDWPREWPDYTNERLIELLRKVPRPPDPAGRSANMRGRRHTDAPAFPARDTIDAGQRRI